MTFTNFKPLDSDTFYGSLINQLPNIIFQIRVHGKQEINIDFISKSVEFLYELSIDEIIKGPYEFAKQRIHKSDLEVFKETFNKTVEVKANWEVDFRFFIPNSGYKWLRIKSTTKTVNNNETILYGSISDITIIKEQQIQLKIADERYQFAVEASDRGIWDWDIKRNKVYYSSESMKILGLEESNLVASPKEWDKRVHPDDREEYYGNINLHFENKTPLYETCHRVLCNGKYKWILDKGKVIERDEDGKPLRIIGTHTDISAQKEKEEELLKMLETVNHQNNKLLNFAHIVSHNLRTHAGNIKSLLELYHDKSFTQVETFENLGIVSKELNETIENLNDLVKVHTETNIEFHSLELKEYINRMLDILIDEIEGKNIQINNNVNSGVYVNCIPAYLESILLNLITNAIKYADDEKDIKISFNIEDLTDYFVLSVSDNGIGIDLERYGKSIFGLYKTFHKNEDSRGVGLYITKNQVETMKGKIEVESQPKIGTTFKVYFKKDI